LDGFGEKKIWKQKIFETIKNNGHQPPGCLIVPKDIMNMEIGRFVDDMLKNK